MSESEDIPIIVHGGPQMINVEIQRSSVSQAPPEKFSLEPSDPQVPFKQIVLWNGDEVMRWELSPTWRIEIRYAEPVGIAEA